MNRQRKRRALLAARAAARQHGLNLKQFNVETSEQQALYKVVFLPTDPQTLGGGLRVWVDKYERQVKQVIPLQ